MSNEGADPDAAMASDNRHPGLHVRVEAIRRHGRTVLRDVRLDLPMPGITFVTGAPGAGKSTLLRAIANEVGADLAIDGYSDVDVSAAPRHDDASPFALLRQGARLECGRTLRDALADFRPGMPIEAWLHRRDLPELAPQLDAPVDVLSRSERRVVAVLVALDDEAPVLLVDEPTAGLDPLHRNAVLHRLAELAATRIVVVATQNERDAIVTGGLRARVADGTVDVLPR